MIRVISLLVIQALMSCVSYCQIPSIDIIGTYVGTYEAQTTPKMIYYIEYEIDIFKEKTWGYQIRGKQKNITPNPLSKNNVTAISGFVQGLYKFKTDSISLYGGVASGFTYALSGKVFYSDSASSSRRTIIKITYGGGRYFPPGEMTLQRISKK